MYRSMLLCLGLAMVGCGDNATSNAGPGDDDDGPPPPDEACSRELTAATLAGGTYDDRFTVQGFTGFDGHSPTVYDFAKDTDGSIVVAGEFQYLGGDRVEPLLRWKNNAWEPARTTWELTPPGAGFAAVAISDTGTLALATYDDFGPRQGEIWIDDGSGLTKIGSFTGLVRRLTWFGGKLWAAGFMQLATTTTPITGLAIWSGTGTAWTAPPGGAADGAVYTLFHDGTNLLVGGSFAHVGGITSASAASFNGTTWSSLSFPNTAIYAFARDGANVLYAAGTFGDQFGTTGGVAKRVGSAWQLAGGGLGNGGIIGVATDLAVKDDKLVVTGCFRTAGGDQDTPDAVIAQGIATFDGTDWQSLDDGSKGVFGPWVQPLACGDEGDGAVFDVSNQRLFVDGQRLLLGGSFPGIDGVMSQAIAAHDGTAWSPQGPSGLGIGGSIDRIAASDTCDVYGYGTFTHVAGTPTTSHVLHFTGTAWETLTDDIPAGSFCPAFTVSKTGEAVLGCMIFPDVGDAVGRVYHVDGGSLVQLGADLPLVQALAFDDDGGLWIGGGGETGFLARFANGTLAMVEAGFDQPVMYVDPASPTDVIVAGTFTKVGTLDASRIARLTDGTWTALADGLPGMPTALAHDAGHVYVSTFDDGSGAGGYLLGVFNPGALDSPPWVDLATHDANLTAVPEFNFNAIRIVGDAIVAVGSAVLDDQAGRGAVVYRNGAFTALGGGVHASLLTDVAITSDAIWVAGSIAEAGPDAARVSSVGVARYVIAK